MRRMLKFHHPKHTGKLIHHRHTSYGVLFALLVGVGVLLVTLTVSAFNVKADDLYVTATVPAPIPTGAPVFTSPSDGYTTDNPTVDFEGTCPVITPAVVIGLYEGATLLGSDQCSPSGNFAISAQLTTGAHSVVATVVTITGDTGESSTPLHVTYTLPVTTIPTSPTTPVTPGQPTSPPSVNGDGLAPILQITSDKPFILFQPGIQTTWKGSFAGGSAPYTVHVNWGDGVSDSFTSDGSAVSYHHTYTTSGSYTITVTITDQAGYSLTRNFAAVDTSQPMAPVQFGLTTSIIDTVSRSSAFQILIIYAAVFILLVAMWRYELRHHKRTVGIPTHYTWQHAGHKRKS
jgi:hypothetical protein